MGLINRRVKRTTELHVQGVHGRAGIEQLTMLHRGEFQLSARHAAGWAAGETSAIRVKLRLRVDVPGRPAYATTVRTQVPMTSFARLGIGGSVPVVVDADDPERLEVDWRGEIVSPTPEQRIAASPFLRSTVAS